MNNLSTSIHERATQSFPDPHPIRNGWSRIPSPSPVVLKRSSPDWQALLAEFRWLIFVPVRHPAYRTAQARADVILAMPDQPEWFSDGTMAALREFAAAVAARGAAELAEIRQRKVVQS